MSEDIKTSKGKLYIVSTPIGNKDDFTIRAMNSLKRCDFVVCEELKVGARTLKQLNLSKELLPLNEHNEIESTKEILDRIKRGEKACLISDDGTPLIADPGNYFIKAALSQDIDIEVVPGVTSIITAIVRSGMPTNQFLFAGFLSRKTEEKFQEVKELSREKRTVVILETPYRLLTTLEILSKIMPNRKAYIGMNLTFPYETHHYGTFEELHNRFIDKEIKAEFVICFEGSDFGKFHSKDDFSEEQTYNRNSYDNRRTYNRDGIFRKDRDNNYNRDRREFKDRGFNRRDNKFADNKFKRDRDDERKPFSKPRTSDFRDSDYEKSGQYINNWNKSSDFKGERKFGDKKKSINSRKASSKSFGKKAPTKFGKRKF